MSEHLRSRPPLPAMFESPPVLITESAEEFERFRDAFCDQLKPRGAIEQCLAADIVHKAWEIRRLHRVKPSLINSAFRRGLKDLLDWISEQPQNIVTFETETHKLAGQWFTDGRVKKQILKILEQFELDEYAIEAQAMRNVARHLEKIDDYMASLEWRLNKTLRLLAELRGDAFGRQLRTKVDRVIDGKVLALDDASKNPAPELA